MNRFLTYCLFLLVAIENNAYAGVDMQCVNNCMSKGYLSQLCYQQCSYDMSTGQAPQWQSGTSIPMQGTPVQIDSNIPLRGVQPVPQVQPLQPIDLNGGQQQSQQLEPQVQQRTVSQQATLMRPITGWGKVNVTFEHMTAYANTASIVRTSTNTVSMWALNNYKATVIASNGMAYLSDVIQREFGCVSKQFRILSASFRTEHMGSGYAQTAIFESGWKPVGTNTLESGLLEMACRNQTDELNKLKSAFEKYSNRVKEICSKPEFAAFFAKTACYGKDISFEQLTDNSKISKEQKSTFPRYRALVDAETKEANIARRAYGGDMGIRSADYLESIQAETDKFNLDLYNGLITWGTYNQLRKELATRANAELSKITQQ